MAMVPPPPLSADVGFGGGAEGNWSAAHSGPAASSSFITRALVEVLGLGGETEAATTDSISASTSSSDSAGSVRTSSTCASRRASRAPDNCGCCKCPPGFTTPRAFPLNVST